jgi:hypothetical protein
MQNLDYQILYWFCDNIPKSLLKELIDTAKDDALVESPDLADTLLEFAKAGEECL